VQELVHPRLPGPWTKPILSPDVVRVDHNVVFPTLQIGNHRGSSPGERIHTAPFVRARKHASFTTAGCRFTPRPLTGEWSAQDRREQGKIARSRYGALIQGDALPPPLDLGRRTGQCPPAAPFTAGRRPPATDGYAAACSRRALSIARCGRRIRPQSRLQRIQIHAPRRHRDRHAPLAWPRRCRSN